MTAARFRRADTMLQTLLGARVAELVCAVVRLCTEQVIPDAHVLNEVSMSFVDLARRLDCATPQCLPGSQKLMPLCRTSFGSQWCFGSTRTKTKPAA